MPTTTTTSLTDSKYFTVTCVFILLLALFPGLPQFLVGLPLCALNLAISATTRQSSSSSSSSSPIVSCPLNSLNNDNMSTSWFQKTFTLPSKSRGSYLITDHVESSLPEIKDYKVGILNLFIQHTSCALSLNENWDSDVREDMSDALDRIAPEDRKGNLYRHSAEGLDDMPVRSKSYTFPT